MSSSGAPCGACKFLRRKCVRGCIFAPYFGAEHGAAKFAAVHKIFGASNVGKLLRLIPLGKRCEAVFTISYEAQARLSDPVYGCVATIFALQQQVASLKVELAMVQSQLASRLADVTAIQAQQQNQNLHQHHPGGGSGGGGSGRYNDQQGMSSTGMAMASSSSVGGYGSCSRVKEEGYLNIGMQTVQHNCYDPGQSHHQKFLENIPSSPPEEDSIDQAGPNPSVQKSHSDSLEQHQQSLGEDVGDLQALAHALLCRK